MRVINDSGTQEWADAAKAKLADRKEREDKVKADPQLNTMEKVKLLIMLSCLGFSAAGLLFMMSSNSTMALVSFALLIVGALVIKLAGKSTDKIEKKYFESYVEPTEREMLAKVITEGNIIVGRDIIDDTAGGLVTLYFKMSNSDEIWIEDIYLTPKETTEPEESLDLENMVYYYRVSKEETSE